MRRLAESPGRDRITLAAACALAAIIVTGCGDQGGARQATVQDCAAVAVTAIRQHIAVRSMPAGCRGLSPAELDQSVADAVHEVAAGVPKAVMRNRASLSSARLSYLIAAAGRAALAAARSARSASGAPGAGPPGARHAGGLRVGAALAALVAWLMTAASGSYLLARWVAHGGMRRARSRSAGLPPAVILGHFGLAIAGLAVWIGYLLTTAAALAWIALGFLLPVVGLGIATLVLSVPETAATSATAIAAQAGTARTPMPVLVIAAHGLLAITTLLLVLLAAVAAR